jgi:Helix-turn-helix domain
MKSFREQNYYELLEVERAAPSDEVRAALRRALETYAPGAVALYSLVDEEQTEALRSRLQEAARVLLDPAARAGYDRMLGLEPEQPRVPEALWAEDSEEESAEGVSAGPYPRTEPAQLERALANEPVNGAQASLKLDAAVARWPSRGPGTSPSGRPPGLPSPTPRASPSSGEPGLGRANGAVARAEAKTPLARAPTEGPLGAEAAQPAPGEKERPRMPELPPGVEFNGELLRQVREARGLTLQQVAERTRIGRMHLERVEADRYADLPPSVYLRGILVSLARELKLDASRVSKSYLLLAARSGELEP